MASDLPQPVHVVAGVLVDARGRILLARRTAGRDLAGAWEFPGGKLERDERPLQALDRELNEELGIRVHTAEPLISVPHAGNGKRIVLDVYRVTSFGGKPKGCEKQALAWAPPEKLATYPMPPADRPVVAALTQPDRCLITPEPGTDTDAFLDRLERALRAGVRRVQLRARSLDAPALATLAQQVKTRCDAHQCELLINGDEALARSLGCGLHLRSEQLLACTQRPVPDWQLLSASCHDAAELAHAQAIGVDFALLGPIQATASHPDSKTLGWTRFSRLREAVALPIYALGGMQPEDIVRSRRHGAQGIAAIRGLWPTD
jgi:8-oxo-dGTP diphosphatase